MSQGDVAAPGRTAAKVLDAPPPMARVALASRVQSYDPAPGAEVLVEGGAVVPAVEAVEAGGVVVALVS